MFHVAFFWCDICKIKDVTHSSLLCLYFNVCNRVDPLLGSEQGLALGQQHPFPWYPPVCTSLSDIPEGHRSVDSLKAMKNRSKLSQKIPDARMKQVRFWRCVKLQICVRCFLLWDVHTSNNTLYVIPILRGPSLDWLTACNEVFSFIAFGGDR